MGQGIYFWDNDSSTGNWWAKDNYGKDNPKVIKAEVDLSDCLDFTNVFAQNKLKHFHNRLESNSALQQEVQQLRKSGLTEDGCLIDLARRSLEIRKKSSFTSIRAPVQMEEDEETMTCVGSTSLITSFRMVIVVYEPSIIGNYEVHDVK